MKKNIASLTTVLLIAVCGFSAMAYGLDWFSPKHKIILAGIVKCDHDGVAIPVDGATVTLIKIVEGDGEPVYEQPVTTVTEAHGAWVIAFDMSWEKSMEMEWRFLGRVTPPCDEKSVIIHGDIQITTGTRALYNKMTGTAGSLADLIKKMAFRALKISVPDLGPGSMDFVAFYGFTETLVPCCDKTPVAEGPEPAVDVTPGPVEAAQPPQTSPSTPPEPATPPDKGWQVPVPPLIDTYGPCIERCRPILDKIAPLEKKLNELEMSESEKEKVLKAEIDRLKKQLEGYIENSKRQKYRAPDGTEIVGHLDTDGYFKKHGYQPIGGMEPFSEAMPGYMDLLKQQIAKAEAKLQSAVEEDYRNKQGERQKLINEIEKLRKEYEDCLRACGKYQRPDDKRKWTDFIPWLTHGRFDYNRKGHYFHPPAAPTPPVPDTGHAMPIEEPRGLEDSSGFDKVPKGTGNIDTYHPVEEPEVGPAEGIIYRGGEAVPFGKEVSLKPVEEAVQYKKIEGDRTPSTCDAAVVYKPTLDGMDVDTAVAVTGKGADFRQWTVDDTTLRIDGELVTPSKKEKIYIEKESYFKGPAVAAFTALGAQYRRHAEEAESGEVCPVTGEKKTASTKKRTDEAIDKAGMAAGMGLLASKAKGEITGQKAVFKLNREQAQKVIDKKAVLQVSAKNKSTHQDQNFKTSIH